MGKSIKCSDSVRGLEAVCTTTRSSIATQSNLQSELMSDLVGELPILWENGLGGGEKKDGAGSQKGHSIYDQKQFDMGDEYQKLARYISNHREGRRRSVASISPDDDAVKKPDVLSSPPLEARQ
ncbi:MAG: hypothetical protein LQ341_000599 [Variospora aurantia]|nr:MAG: hypothetical protein LQ341_000599 [Variospora aurantia]